MSPSAAPQIGFREVLKVPGVSRLWAAQIVSIFGDFLAIFAIFSVVTFRFRGSPEQVTLILVAFLTPFAVIGPVAGALVDRWNVRITMIASDLIRAVLALLLPLAHNVSQIYAILLALSTVSIFFYPAQSVTIRSLVPASGLMSANALMAQAMQVMQIVSPAIAGALVAWLGPNSCFWFDSFSFVFSATMIFGISVSHQPVTAPLTLRSVVSSTAAGMRFIFTHAKVSFVILAMMAGMFAIRSFGALIAVYVRDVLSAGSVLFGMLSSMVGLGMIAGTQFINRFAGKRPRNEVVVAGLLGIGLSILGVASVVSIPSTVLGMLGIGVFAAFTMIPAQTLIQEETPKEMLGRVSSSMWSVLSIAQVTAMLIAGPVAQMAGIRSLYFGSSAFLLLIAGFGYLQLRKVSGHQGKPVELRSAANTTDS
jgi:MFS family permease